jgi:putative metallohydrolase (TIGR04338 family)
MKRPRDSQKTRVYNAERALQCGDQGWTYRETQKYVNDITKTRWWQNRGGPPFVLVKDGRGTTWAKAWDPYTTDKGEDRPATISLPRWARDPVVVLHELSHILTPDTEAAHGPAYCANYLTLVKRFIGEEAHRTLRDSFKEHKVKWYSERKDQA